jgi:integrase
VKSAATAGRHGTSAAGTGRIRAEFGTPEFEAEYRVALDGAPIQVVSKKAATGTLAWLWNCYRETTAWTALSLATGRQRENIMRPVLAKAGTVTATVISRAHIVDGRERRRETPAQARHFINTMRGLFRWAADAGLVKADPTVGVKYPPKRKSAGFPVWTEDDVARYEARWPIGTKERVWLGVLLYTGLRRSDAVRLGRQHVRDGTATLRTKKNGVTVTIPILPALDDILRAGPAPSPLSVAREDSHSPRNRSAICPATPAMPRVSPRARTAFARSAQPVPR